MLNSTFLALALLAVNPSGKVGAIKWKPDYNTALAAAKSSGKLMMVDFYADW